MRTTAMVLALMAVGVHAAAAQQPAATPTFHAKPAAGAPASRRPRRSAADRLRRVVDIIPGNGIDDTGRRLASARATLGETLLTSTDEQTTFLLVHRTVSSKPEVHARWDDVLVIRGGTGAVLVGDSLVGSRLRAPGERIGGALVDTFRVVLQAGDIVRIPATVPHAIIASPKAPLDYLVIKERRQDLPIRWYGEQDGRRR